MGKSIDPAGRPRAQRGSRFDPAPRPIASMSLRLVIPRQVVLHQSPPPLHQPQPTMTNNRANEDQNPVNGELSKPKLSHPRGSPQKLSSPATEHRSNHS